MATLALNMDLETPLGIFEVTMDSSEVVGDELILHLSVIPVETPDEEG